MGGCEAGTPGLIARKDVTSRRDVRIRKGDGSVGKGNVRRRRGDVRRRRGNVRMGRRDVRIGRGDVRMGRGDVRMGRGTSGWERMAGQDRTTVWYCCHLRMSDLGLTERSRSGIGT